MRVPVPAGFVPIVWTTMPRPTGGWWVVMAATRLQPVHRTQPDDEGAPLPPTGADVTTIERTALLWYAILPTEAEAGGKRSTEFSLDVTRAVVGETAAAPPMLYAGLRAELHLLLFVSGVSQPRAVILFRSTDPQCVCGGVES